jgi:hypothetical protein
MHSVQPNWLDLDDCTVVQHLRFPMNFPFLTLGRCETDNLDFFFDSNKVLSVVQPLSLLLCIVDLILFEAHQLRQDNLAIAC